MFFFVNMLLAPLAVCPPRLVWQDVSSQSEGAVVSALRASCWDAA